MLTFANILHHFTTGRYHHHLLPFAVSPFTISFIISSGCPSPKKPQTLPPLQTPPTSSYRRSHWGDLTRSLRADAHPRIQRCHISCGFNAESESGCQSGLDPVPLSHWPGGQHAYVCLKLESRVECRACRDDATGMCIRMVY